MSSFSGVFLSEEEQVCAQENIEYYISFYGVSPDKKGSSGLKDVGEMLLYHYSNSPLWIVQLYLRSISLPLFPWLSVYQLASLICLLVSFRWLWLLYDYWLYHWGLAVFFLNPVVSAYFTTVGLEWISFFCISGMLFAKKHQKTRAFLLLMALLFLSNLKFHFLLFIPFALILLPDRSKKFWTLLIILKLLLLVIPAKNLYMAGSFGYTFWLPLNLANNYNYLENENLSGFPNFGSAQPENVINHIESPFERKWVSNNHYNNINYNIYNSEEFYLVNQKMAAIIKETAGKYILSRKGIETAIRNAFHYFNPLIRHFWAIRIAPRIDLHENQFYIDNERKWDKSPGRSISIYFIAFLCMLVCYFYSHNTIHRPFIWLFLFHFLVCIFIDGNESNRMRFAVEPILILFPIYGLVQLAKTIQMRFFKRELRSNATLTD